MKLVLTHWQGRQVSPDYPDGMEFTNQLTLDGQSLIVPEGLVGLEESITTLVRQKGLHDSEWRQTVWELSDQQVALVLSKYPKL